MNVKPEISKKSTYYVEKHRYYELKHFCLQYPIWKKAKQSIDAMASRPIEKIGFTPKDGSSPVQKCIDASLYLAKRIELVEDTAAEAGEDLKEYLLAGVINGFSYDQVRARYDIPCCRDKYYEIYRKFFWLLNKYRG